MSANHRGGSPDDILTSANGTSITRREWAKQLQAQDDFRLWTQANALEAWDELSSIQRAVLTECGITKGLWAIELGMRIYKAVVAEHGLPMTMAEAERLGLVPWDRVAAMADQQVRAFEADVRAHGITRAARLSAAFAEFEEEGERERPIERFRELQDKSLRGMAGIDEELYPEG